MPHPFEVGKTYRNRAGEYVVLAIDNDQMKIRYASGGVLQTDVNVQARIWENIQFEEQLSRAEERKRQAQEARLAARMKIREARAKPTFAGFQEDDFQAKKRGVAWLARKSLGRALAYDLGHRTKQAFEYWPVPRQSVLHIARKDRYDATALDRNAAFSVVVSESGVACGLYVGRPEGEVAPGGHWALLMSALAGGQALRQAVRAAMETHGLGLDVYAMQVSYGLVARVTIRGDGFLWRQEAAQQDLDRAVSWEELMESLRTLIPGKRCEICLCRHLSPEQALGAGPHVVDQLADVLADLMPAYDACLPGEARGA